MNCDSTQPITVELESAIESFNSTLFKREVSKLLHLDRQRGDRVVIDSVVPGSVLVTFHVEGRSITTTQAVHELQTAVQAAADHHSALALGGSLVMVVDGRRPFVVDTTSDCDADAYIFDGPAKNVQNFTGVCAGLCFLLLALSSCAYVRRKHYQFFIRCHISFAALGFIALLFHFDFGKMDVMAPFLFLLATDYALRGWRLLMEQATVVSRTQLGEGDSSLVLLEVDAPAVSARHTEPGQYCFIRLPQLARLQWHPMTIVSPPGADKLVFCIQAAAGDWSRGLSQITYADGYARIPRVPDGAAIGLDGPYGRLSVRLDRQTVLLICGGVGVTPMLSILAYLLRSGASGVPGASAPIKVWFVWAVRQPMMPLVEHFAPLLEQAVAAGHCVRIHCTAAAVAATAGEEEPQAMAAAVERENNPLTEGHGDQGGKLAEGSSQVSSQNEAAAVAAMADGRGGTSANPVRRPLDEMYERGRPDMPSVLREVAAAASEGRTPAEVGQEVAVLACGPAGLVDAARVACITEGSRRVVRG